MNQENTPHILLIEDDRFFSELLARQLRENGCVVAEKENLEAARGALEKERFSVICFDLVVLGAAGFKKLSELMTSDFFGRTPVLLLTDGELDAEATSWAPNAALAHLVKSEATPDEIVSRIISLAASARA